MRKRLMKVGERFQKEVNREIIQTLPYRKCVSIVLTKIECSNKLIFLGERVDFKNSWQMPQGGVDEGESYLEAAKRELLEETGISSVKFISQTEKLYKYNFLLSSQKDMMKKYGYIKYAGQELRFIELKFTGDESEINLDYDTKEFNNWKWVSPREVLNSIVDFKYSCYREGFAELGLV